MPKLIENVREKILTEAEKQVLEAGYSAMTIRSVAAACGIAAGTVYNYFPSKEMLVASFMVRDWTDTVSEMKTGCEESSSPEEMLRAVYASLRTFTDAHTGLFKDPEAMSGYSLSYTKRHGMVVSQIASVMEPYCMNFAKDGSPYLSEFLAGGLLSCTMSGQNFDEFIKLSKKLFN